MKADGTKGGLWTHQHVLMLRSGFSQVHQLDMIHSRATARTWTRPHITAMQPHNARVPRRQAHKHTHTHTKHMRTRLYRWAHGTHGHTHTRAPALTQRHLAAILREPPGTQHQQHNQGQQLLHARAAGNVLRITQHAQSSPVRWYSSNPCAGGGSVRVCVCAACMHLKLRSRLSFCMRPGKSSAVACGLCLLSRCYINLVHKLRQQAFCCIGPWP